MGWEFHHHHLREAHMQQRAQLVVGTRQRPGHPCRKRGLAAGARAQHREADRFQQGAIAHVLDPGQVRGQFGLQRTAAVHHGVHYAGREDPHRHPGLGAHGNTRSRRALR